jgi:hypothetical protein
MPEALAIVAVLFIAAAVYFYARLEARNPARHNPAQDLARLHQHASWLQNRLHIAEQEHWDADMIASLATELELASRQLARASSEPGQR